MRRILAAGIPVCTVILLVVASALSAWAGTSVAHPLSWLPLSLSCAAVGSVLWFRRVGGAIASLFVAMGIYLAAGTLVGAYADAASAHHLPGASWAAWLFQVSLSFSVIFFLILQLFPTGRPLSPRWRVVVWLSVVAAALSFLAPALGVTAEFTANFPGLTHPLPLFSPGLTRSLDDAAGIAVTFVFIASALEIVLRYRRSVGDERVQMKWFAAASAVAVVGFVIAFFALPSGPAPAFALLAPLIPIAAGVAILRYHLYDVDLVISKTVLFAALAAFITGVYVAIVVGVGSLTGSSTDPLLSVAATALVATLFQPVRRRAQGFANRLVFGERATPYEVMAGFSSRVADSVSTDEVLPQMAEAAGRGVGAVEAAVRVLLADGAERIERWSSGSRGTATSVPWTTPIAYRGEPVGDLTVRKPVNDPLVPAERRLLEDLGAQAGLALHNVRLGEELAIRLRELDQQSAALRLSRERLVTARDAQRRGLQRDIHDGPERQLLDIGHRLRRVAEPEQLDPLIDRANEILEGLRDLARGIFPPLLADEGIVPALQAHVRKIGADASIRAAPDVAASRFDPDAEACAYFCCLQAIQNVMRHAGGAPCTITLARMRDALVFEIRDEGPGFDVASTRRGMGIDIMQDRVDALDGTLTITSEPGGGTRVRGEIPVQVREGSHT